MFTFLDTNMVKPEDYPKSYWDIVDPKWKGRVAIRDPRSSGGGAWHMLGIYNTEGMGIDYIKKLKATVEPFIVRGGSRKLRDAIARGQFALGFSGRGENIRDLPKGTPVKFVVPKEGQGLDAVFHGHDQGCGPSERGQGDHDLVL